MKQTTIRKAVMVALILAGICPIEAQVPQALQVKERQLSNGMTVWLNEDHSLPKVYGSVVVNAGAKDCPNTGIAHYFEHIMFKGTEEIGTIDYASEKPWLDSISAAYDRLAATHDEAARMAIQKDINRLSLKAGEYAIPNEFNNLISRYGGSQLNAGTSYDFTFYHNTFVPQFLEQWCQLNSDRLINPVYRMFQGELETVYEEKNRGNDNMANNLRQTIFKELFGTNAYAYPVIGSTEHLKNPQLSEMKKFYEKYYVGCNMGLILAGDFDADNVMPLLERTFGRIPAGVMPTHVKSPMPDILEERTVEMRLPIPLVSMEMLVFKSPTQFEKDANAVDIATQLLSNGKAGKLDSLVTERRLLVANMTATSLNDAGLTIMMLMPNLLAKSKNAENACLTEIRHVAEGQFNEKDFQAIKLNAYHEALLEIENMQDRFQQMVQVMSSGHSWQDYLDKVNAIKEVTRADVIAATKKYYTAPFVRFKKKYGDVEKDKMSQPGYIPVIPKNKGEESEYAKRLASIPVKDVEPRTVDLDRDAVRTPLGGQAFLYTVKNPVNDLFKLTISYNRGERADARMASATAFVNEIGTDSLTRQQLNAALQLLGSSLEISSELRSTEIVVTGVDKNFGPTMQLVGHLLLHPKSDEKTLSTIKDAIKAEEKSLTEENQDVFAALYRKVLFGNQSSNLQRLTYKEAKKLTGNKLIDVFNTIFGSACDIVYSGTLDTREVETVVRKTLPLERSQAAYNDYNIEFATHDQPVVYVYDMPKTRQTLFFTSEMLKPAPTRQDRAKANLLQEYLGGGMSSVLFQEVREFRSMAYTTQSTLMTKTRKKYPNSPLCLLAFVGTQADKTMTAISLVDSLLHDMPMIEKNFHIARQNRINELNNSYPTFREIGSNIASTKREGYVNDDLKGTAAIYRSITMDDMKQYFNDNIRNNGQRRVLGIIGNKKKLDLKALEKYGQVIILKEKDLFRK